MRDRIFHVALALFLVGGTWLAARGEIPSGKDITESAATVPHAADNSIDVQTGEKFWGLQLCGVVPCSTLVVKGGGHLVTIAFDGESDARCFYHVIGEKRIDVNGRAFRLRVEGPETVHVERVIAADDHVAAR